MKKLAIVAMAGACVSVAIVAACTGEDPDFVALLPDGAASPPPTPSNDAAPGVDASPGTTAMSSAGVLVHEEEERDLRVDIERPAGDAATLTILVDAPPDKVSIAQTAVGPTQRNATLKVRARTGAAFGEHAILLVARDADGRERARATTAVVVAGKPGTLDPTFGSSGFVTREPGVDGNARGIAVQGDGKIVAVGNVGASSFVLRLTTTGSIDTSFGNVGTVALGTDNPRSVLIARDRILVAVPVSRGFRVRALELTAGSADATFADGGLFETISPAVHGEFLSWTLSREGSVVGSGHLLHDGGNYESTLIRVKAPGALDESFGDGGRVSYDLVDASTGAPDGMEGFGAVASADDGGLAAGGTMRAPDGGTFQWVLARLRSDGTPDLSFRGTGFHVDPSAERTHDIAALVTLADGTIGVTGYETSDTGKVMWVGFLEPNANDLVRRVAGFGSGATFGSALVVDPEQRVVACGTQLGDQAFALRRYTAAHAADATFGTGPIRGETVEIGAGHRCNALAIDRFGRILLAGRRASSFVVARYWP